MSLDAILKQYKKNTSNASSKKMSNEERLKQYFTTYIPDGVQSKTKRIRILPVGENQTPFVEVKGHKAQVGGQWRTFICPKHEKDEECPFCEAREALLATGEKDDKELAKKFYPRLMYVVKVIDREHEDEGVKFWRFNHDFRKTGIYDKIMGVVQAIQGSAAPDFTDVENGRDLNISINRDQNNRPTVSSIAQGDPSPLHADKDTVEAWLSDDRTWEDVYSVKPYSYLEIIVKGGEPTWKRNASGEGGEWIDKNALSEDSEKGDGEGEELTIGNDKSNESKSESKETETQKEPATTGESESDEDDDDLPF
jgi:hypothetical protein